MIRPATLADRNRIVHLALREARKYPLRPDTDKVKDVVTQAISSAKHFCWVVEEGQEVKGALIGLTSDNLWAQRANCNIALWVAHVRGEGVLLLRKFTEWVNSRRIIKVAGMVLDNESIDARVGLLLERNGFERHGGAYLLYN